MVPSHDNLTCRLRAGHQPKDLHASAHVTLEMTDAHCVTLRGLGYTPMGGKTSGVRFPYCCNKPDQQLQEESSTFAQGSRVQVHHGRGMAAEGKAAGHMTSTALKQREGTLVHSSLSPFYSVWGPSHRMVLPVVRVGLPTSAPPRKPLSDTPRGLTHPCSKSCQGDSWR